MIKHYIYLLIIVVVCSACKTRNGQQPSQTGALHPDSVLASIERSPCFGKCPAFKATVYNNGKATYEGRSSVEKLGLYTGSMSEQQMKAISDKALEFRLDTLKSEYINEYLVDFPGHNVAVVINGQLKTIMVMETELPGVIYTYEAFLENMFEQVNWTKVEMK